MRYLHTALVCAALLAGLGPTGAGGGDLPFVETFDARSKGDLNGQNAWRTAQEQDVQVQTATVHAGAQAAVIATNAVASHDFDDAGATNVWVDFYARATPRAVAGQPSLSSDAVAGFYVGTNGQIVARSNETWVALGGFTATPDTWYRFSVNLDYGAQRWAIHVADSTPNRLSTPVATNLAFTSTATNTSFHSFRMKN